MPDHRTELREARIALLAENQSLEKAKSREAMSLVTAYLYRRPMGPTSH